MLDFFELVVSYIELIWEFFLNFITSLLSLVTAVAGAMVLPNALIASIGGQLGASIIAVGSFSIIKLLVGRENV